MGMNPAVVAKSAKNVLRALEINFNRLAGHEFVPKARDRLNIETSSICNLKCRFCAYDKKQSAKISMKNEFFVDCVTQALDLGYRKFELTPCTGDVFMDRHIFGKLEFLDNNPDVVSYDFFTNFTIPKQRQVEHLARLQKLSSLFISIYGHDLETFIAITRSTDKVYRRLVSNLQTLLGLLDQKKFSLGLGIRSTRDMPRHPVSELMTVLERFEAAGIRVRRSEAVYNNWGGYITGDDVKGLAMAITGSDAVYKYGACERLFTSVQIMATGIVNACACRDVDATLRIGDLNEKPLREILSTRNQVYMDLIEEQQRGEFRPVCRSCDYYKSIYHKRSMHRRNATELQSIEEFKVGLDAAAKVGSTACG
jgi:sulfatase maturation enzyme AslB (radical SAM superfamily)